MPDGPYSLDARLARVEQRVSDLDHRMTELAAIAPTVIRLSEQFATIHRDLATYAHNVQKLDDEINEREMTARRDRREARRWMIGLAISILVALGSLAIVILTTAPVH